MATKKRATHITRADHRKRALQAAKLRASGLPWRAVADHLGYSTAQAASRAVARHTNPQHPNAVNATRQPAQVADTETPEARDKALEAGALRTVGLTWQQIAERLGYPSAGAARKAWVRHRHNVAPREYAATRADRWENLFRRNMTLLAETLAADSPDLVAARAHIAQAQVLLQSQPKPEWDTAEVAGAVLAAHFAAAE